MGKLYDHPAVTYACFRPRPGPTLPVTPQGRPVDLELDDGTMVGGYLHVRLSGAPTLLVLHGEDDIVADDLGFWPEWSEAIGANFFFLDWPGYASSSGSPSFSACREAAHKALEYLLDASEAEVPSVVVLGRSLGALFAIDLFKDGTPPRVNGLVIEGGLTDVADWVAERVPWEKTDVAPEDVMSELDTELFRDFHTEETLKSLSVPALVIHGILDSEVPVQNGETLAEWADCREVVLLENGDHGNLPQLNADSYRSALADYLAEVAPWQRG
jgi:pimeloyl-ACP methyl ester carboxylesterase